MAKVEAILTLHHLLPGLAPQRLGSLHSSLQSRMSLPSALSSEERAELLSDIPPRPFPTYDELPYESFLNDHMIPNTPFLFSPAATASWPARKSWATPSPTPGPSLPNLEALRVYGDQTVPVADTSQREYSEFERSDQPLSTVLETWARGSGATLYVKDWHLIAELESHSQPASSIYSPPPCFRDDWLSPPFDRPGATDVPAATADFRFVYLGPAGTFTPLHRDVYASYSWSANVVGRKVWWLFPPGVEAELKDARGELEFDIRSVPRAAQRGIKILQEEGEVLFVPSGWHHQVVNVDFCISINHNFFASPTLARIYAALRQGQSRVEASIADVLVDIRARLPDTQMIDGVPEWKREWAAEVDGLLARDAGWGWSGFWACVRDNLLVPPARPALSPKPDVRDEMIRRVVRLYRSSDEWELLPEARAIVLQVERLLEQHD